VFAAIAIVLLVVGVSLIAVGIYLLAFQPQLDVERSVATVQRKGTHMSVSSSSRGLMAIFFGLLTFCGSWVSYRLAPSPARPRSAPTTRTTDAPRTTSATVLDTSIVRSPVTTGTPISSFGGIPYSPADCTSPILQTSAPLQSPTLRESNAEIETAIQNTASLFARLNEAGVTAGTHAGFLPGTCRSVPVPGRWLFFIGPFQSRADATAACEAARSIAASSYADGKPDELPYLKPNKGSYSCDLM
jgi:hypothetical protein